MRLRSHLLPHAAGALVLLLGSSALAEERIVDPRGTGDFLTIQAAVDASVSGDVVLVYPGTYPEDVLIDGKGITLVAQQAGTARIAGQLELMRLPAAEFLFVHGMDVEGETDPTVDEQPATLLIGDCDGALRLERCRFEGADASENAFFDPTGGTAAELVSVRQLIARRTTFVGGDGVDEPLLSCNSGDGGLAIDALQTRLALYGCEVVGGAGMSCSFDFGEGPGDGGDALILRQSELFVSGSSISGGRGGNNGDFLPLDGADGGDGLLVQALSRALLVETTITGGAGGTSFAGQNGAPGQAILGSGSLRMLPGPSETHDMPVFVLGQSQHPIEVHGAPGAEATLHLLPVAPFLFDSIGRATGPAISANQLGPLTGPAIPLGTIPPSGVLLATLGVPAVPGSATTFPLDFVITTRTGAAKTVLGSPMRAIVVQCGTLQPDCNGNGRADLCELVEGAPDCDLDGILDACQPDCNANGIADPCDIASGTSQDENQNGVPDECEPTNATWYVDDSATPGGDGSFGAPFQSLQAAFAVALGGDEVVLFDGLYRGPENRNQELNGRALTIRSLNGPANCVVDLEDAGRALQGLNVPVSETVTVEGLTFRRGLAPATGGSPAGGALLLRSCTSVVRDCVFEDNRANAGGALALSALPGGSILVEGCVFDGNEAAGGGALSVVFSSAIVESCVFTDNYASSYGGAVDISASAQEPSFLSRCTFIGNVAGSIGGAVSTIASLGPGELLEVAQCRFLGNSAILGGAFVGSSGASAVFGNCLFVGNEAANEGGALILDAGIDARVVSSILWGNTAPLGAQASVRSSGSVLELQWSNVEGGAAAVLTSGGGTLLPPVGLVSADPLFVSSAGPDGDPSTYADNDYRLGAGSPSIDAGDSASLLADRSDLDGDGDRTEPLPLDLDDQPRRADDPAVPDTGPGSAPIVDHGPYERQ